MTTELTDTGHIEAQYRPTPSLSFQMSKLPPIGKPISPNQMPNFNLPKATQHHRGTILK